MSGSRLYDAALLSRPGIRLCVSVLALGHSVFHIPAALGQEPGKTSLPLTAPLRISVASSVARGCGNKIVPEALQQNAEGQLRGVGVAVSSIHNAQLVIDVDCVAVAPRARRAGVAVHQCLGFSELVSTPSNNGKAMLASTWRKCQSYPCTGNCEPLVRSGQQTLMTAFLSDFQERIPRNLPALPQPSPKPAQNSPAKHSPNAIYAAPANAGRTVFYFLYIMACFSVMCYWQCRRSSFGFN